MQSKLVKESLFEFKKGMDPIDSLGMGRRAQIKNWLDSMNVTNYTINDDYTIDVYRNVNLEYRNLKEFPEFIQFGEIKGGFNCRNNNLESLRGCPEICTYFSCHNNKLTSLEDAPKLVYGWFECGHNAVSFITKDVRKVSDVKGSVLT